MGDTLSRREFLKKGGAVIAVGALGTPWIAKAVHADAFGLPKRRHRTLVVCQLTGGNDGFNTIIPFTQKAYYRLRPTLAIRERAQIPISDRLALHPALEGLRRLWDKKWLAIVNGVGYPNPSRSHSRSMEVWHTASTQAEEQYGWLGRYLDGAYDPTNPVMALALGVYRVQALNARNVCVPTFASLADIQAMAADSDAKEALGAVQESDFSEGSQCFEATRAGKPNLDAMSGLNRKLGKYRPRRQFGNDPFGNGFREIAHIIAVSPKTNVIYFSVGGFDTHSAQAAQHARLLRSFGDALYTFFEELAALGREEDVTVVVFSEFGRSLQENASGGTDHGTAGPMFVIGGSVKPGLHGSYPSLEVSDWSDFEYTVDFRRVYASILTQWLGADAGALIGKEFEPLDLFSV